MAPRRNKTRNIFPSSSRKTPVNFFLRSVLYVVYRVSTSIRFTYGVLDKPVKRIARKGFVLLDLVLFSVLFVFRCIWQGMLKALLFVLGYQLPIFDGDLLAGPGTGRETTPTRAKSARGKERSQERTDRPTRMRKGTNARADQSATTRKKTTGRPTQSSRGKAQPTWQADGSAVERLPDWSGIFRFPVDFSSDMASEGGSYSDSSEELEAPSKPRSCPARASPKKTLPKGPKPVSPPKPASAGGASEQTSESEYVEETEGLVRVLVPIRRWSLRAFNYLTGRESGQAREDGSKPSTSKRNRKGSSGDSPPSSDTQQTTGQGADEARKTGDMRTLDESKSTDEDVPDTDAQPQPPEEPSMIRRLSSKVTECLGLVSDVMQEFREEDQRAEAEAVDTDSTVPNSSEGQLETTDEESEGEEGKEGGESDRKPRAETDKEKAKDRAQKEREADSGQQTPGDEDIHSDVSESSPATDKSGTEGETERGPTAGVEEKGEDTARGQCQADSGEQRLREEQVESDVSESNPPSDKSDAGDGSQRGPGVDTGEKEDASRSQPETDSGQQRRGEGEIQSDSSEPSPPREDREEGGESEKAPRAAVEKQKEEDTLSVQPTADSGEQSRAEEEVLGDSSHPNSPSHKSDEADENEKRPRADAEEVKEEDGSESRPRANAEEVKEDGSERRPGANAEEVKEEDGSERRPRANAEEVKEDGSERRPGANAEEVKEDGSERRPGADAEEVKEEDGSERRPGANAEVKEEDDTHRPAEADSGEQRRGQAAIQIVVSEPDAASDDRGES